MPYEVQLTPHEARVLGVLVEKSFTTPDQYPLTLNAAVNAANQKTNRDPVLELEEYDVARALKQLESKHLARAVFPENSRVEKFSHRCGEQLGVAAAPLAILAELLLRGPQTPGELRQRAGRMSPLESLPRTLEALQPLIERGYARRLPPAPGSRAERYGQLLCPESAEADREVRSEETPFYGRPPSAETSSDSDSELASRVAALETEAADVRRRLEALEARLAGASPPREEGEDEESGRE